jgi:histidinol dehydrogenase
VITIHIRAQYLAFNLLNEYAAEHLIIASDNADELCEKVINAGSVFLGHYSPESVGDYIAGPSHVLPTSGTARFASGLSVYDFLKRISLISCDEKSFSKLAKHTEILAESEGLGAHKLSVSIRKYNLF